MNPNHKLQKNRGLSPLFASNQKNRGLSGVWGLSPLFLNPYHHDREMKGTLVDSLSVSIGSASSTEIEEFTLDRLDDFIHIADIKCM